MKAILIGIRALGLVLTIVPAFFVFSGQLSFELHKSLMAAGCLMWFLPPLFSGQDKPDRTG